MSQAASEELLGKVTPYGSTFTRSIPPLGPVNDCMPVGIGIFDTLWVAASVRTASITAGPPQIVPLHVRPILTIITRAS